MSLDRVDRLRCAQVADRDDERLERIHLALTWVPLSHYDAVQKLAEAAVAEFIEERDAAVEIAADLITYSHLREKVRTREDESEYQEAARLIAKLDALVEATRG